MTARYRWRISAVAVALACTASLSGAVYGHDVPHGSRSGTRTRIDPRVTYSSRLVAAGGGHFHALLVGPDVRWILAGTHLGLFRSHDRGLTWQLVAPRFSGEDVHALVRDVKTGRISAATHGQGLVVSADGGRSWTDDSRGLPSRDLHALALDPGAPSRTYVWVVGHGLLRRDGAGAAWQRLVPASTLGDVRTLAVHPSDRDRIYAATATGVWVSRDGGHHWERPPDGLRTPVGGLALVPGREGILLAATEDGLFAGDTTARQWRRAGSAPDWWGPLVAFAVEPGRGHVIALSHEGVVARRVVEAGEWTPLPEAGSSHQPSGQSSAGPARIGTGIGEGAAGFMR
jgi:hypothetical protein